MKQTHEMQTGHTRTGQSGMSGYPGPSSINPLHQQQPVFSTPVASRGGFGGVVVRVLPSNL